VTLPLSVLGRTTLPLRSRLLAFSRDDYALPPQTGICVQIPRCVNRCISTVGAPAVLTRHRRLIPIPRRPTVRSAQSADFRSLLMQTRALPCYTAPTRPCGTKDRASSMTSSPLEAHGSARAWIAASRNVGSGDALFQSHHIVCSERPRQRSIDESIPGIPTAPGQYYGNISCKIGFDGPRRGRKRDVGNANG